MPQSFLGANPGTNVKDALAPELLDGSDVAGGVTGSAVEVNFPGRVGILLETGTMDGTGAAVRVEIQGADDSGFTDDVVTLGVFDDLDEDDDDIERVITVHAWKPYLRAVVTESGTVNAAPITVTVVPEDFHTGNTRTA